MPRQITALLGAAVVSATLFAAPGAVLAKEAGDFLVRLRMASLAPETNGTTREIGGAAKVNQDTVPEVDFTYFLTDNIAAELILATTRHRASVLNSTSGDVDLGEVSLLPPALTLQYHFTPKAKFSPYIGAGLSYVMFYDVDKGPGLTAVKYKDSLGYAFQAGLDVALDDRWSLNFDIKKIYVDTDITVNNGGINPPGVDLNPWVFSVGFGYRF
jgi:outer membrane protein